MKFTPGQLRNVTSISQETYRHWKKSFSNLEKSNSKKPCFSAGDLLAVLIIRSLTQSFRIQVSALTDVSGHLFSLTNSTPWFNLERGVLLVSLPEQRVELISATSPFIPSHSLLVLPLNELTQVISESLLSNGQTSSQRTLQFPLFQQVSNQSKPSEASTRAKQS